MGVRAGLVFLVLIIVACGAFLIWRGDIAVTALTGMEFVPVSSRAPPRPRPRGERVAVVFYGVRLHAFDVIAKKGRKSAVEMAVEELDADVFVYGSSAFNASAALRPMRHRIKGLHLGRQMTREQLAALRDGGVDYAKARFSGVDVAGRLT